MATNVARHCRRSPLEPRCDQLRTGVFGSENSAPHIQMATAVNIALIVQAAANGLAVSIAYIRAQRRSAAEAAYWRKHDAQMLPAK
jgi:hypothetical protein